MELDTTVNANMLRQPVAKEIRTYAQKLICLLQKSDAIWLYTTFLPNLNITEINIILSA